MSKDRAKPLSPKALVDLINAGGWVIKGGSAITENLIPLMPLALSTSLFAESGEEMYIVTSQSGHFSAKVGTFTVSLVHPWAIHIHRLFGGANEVPRPGVWLSFYNEAIREEHRNGHLREEERRLEQERQKHAAFLEHLGVVGKAVKDVVLFPQDRGLVIIMLDDGRELRIEGDLLSVQAGPPLADEKE